MAHERKILKCYMKTENANKIEKNDIIVILDAFEMWLHQDWITPEDWEAVEIVWTTLRNTLSKILEFDASCDHHIQLLRIFEFSLQHDLVGKSYFGGQLTIYGHVVKEILLSFVHPNHINPDVIIGFIPHAFTLMKIGLSHVKNSAAAFIYTLNTYPHLLQPYITDIMDCYLKHHHFNLAACLTVLFPYHEDLILAHLNDISHKIEELPAMEKYNVFRLYEVIAYKFPQEILPYMRHLTADFSDAVVSSASLPCLCILSDHYIERFTELIDKLSMLVERQPYHVGYVDNILTKIAMQSETEARKVLTNCLVQFKAVDKSYYAAIFTCIRDIGLKYKKLLTNYRSAIETFGASDGKTQNYVKSLLDYIEGKSEEPDLIQLQTQRSVRQSSNQVPILKKQICEKKEEATSQKKTNKSPKNTIVTENKQEVIPIPEWCTTLAQLLDKQGDRDWRFLAINLGFSLEDVQSVSMTTSPTTSVLKQWFKGHDEREGTHAVYVALQQLRRADGIEVIEKAVSKKEQLIPQTLNGTTDKLAPVYISYHGDNITEVKLLCYHLELAGLKCCMDEDISQRSDKDIGDWLDKDTGDWLDNDSHDGNDQSCKRMDEAMRGGHLVLAMFSTSFIQSKTCLKQVKLALHLNKPIIPVVIGPLSWPPSGPMGILLSHLPCLQLYQFSANNRRGRIFWPLSHFLQLLARIYYYVSPDLNKISKQEYKHLVPALDNISHNLHEHLLQVPAVTKNNHEASIFISYQWNKIGEALVLNTLLTHLGFECWLDIHHLGQGTVMHRADTAIMKSKVMICCVTPEYSTQPSCCREVTMASVLNLPIIPLVMEKMFWPPRGPLSLPFTNSMYLDYTCEEFEASFTYQRLQLLYDQLKQFVESSKDGKVEELFTKTVGVQDVDMLVSSDIDSADEEEKEETVAVTTTDDTTSETCIVCNGNAMQEHVDQVQSEDKGVKSGPVISLDDDIRTEIPEFSADDTNIPNTESVQTSSTPLISENNQQTPDSNTIAKVNTDAKCEETTNNHITSPWKQTHNSNSEQNNSLSNGVNHHGPNTNHTHNDMSTCNGKLNHPEKSDPPIITNSLPSKTDEEIKKSNVCTIL